MNNTVTQWTVMYWVRDCIIFVFVPSKLCLQVSQSFDYYMVRFSLSAGQSEAFLLIPPATLNLYTWEEWENIPI